VAASTTLSRVTNGPSGQFSGLSRVASFDMSAFWSDDGTHLPYKEPPRHPQLLVEVDFAAIMKLFLALAFCVLAGKVHNGPILDHI